MLKAMTMTTTGLGQSRVRVSCMEYLNTNTTLKLKLQNQQQHLRPSQSRFQGVKESTVKDSEQQANKRKQAQTIGCRSPRRSLAVCLHSLVECRVLVLIDKCKTAK